MSLDYILTSLIVILLPGTGVLYTLAVGLNAGIRAGIYAAFGCTLGILPHIAASIFGLAALLHASAMAFGIVKLLGVAYLFYMAVMVLRGGGGLEIAQTRSSVPALKTVLTGILLNVLNPKLSLFFLAFLPQFITPGTQAPTRELLLLAAIFMALTFLVFVTYGAFASLARRRVLAQPQVMIWMRRSFAAAFGLMGLKLALSAR